MNAGPARGAERARGEAGFVGGIEALPLGVLVFVVGALIVANAWGAVDARFAADAAARATVRTFVEASGDPATAAAFAVERGERTAADLGWPDADVRFVGAPGLDRCTPVEVVVSIEVPALVRLARGAVAYTMRANHVEIVDPHRSGLTGDGCG